MTSTHDLGSLNLWECWFYVAAIMGVVLKFSHKRLTERLHGCYNSGAFSQTSEGALFLLENKAPFSAGLFYSCSLIGENHG